LITSLVQSHNTLSLCQSLAQNWPCQTPNGATPKPDQKTEERNDQKGEKPENAPVILRHQPARHACSIRWIGPSFSCPQRECRHQPSSSFKPLNNYQHQTQQQHHPIHTACLSLQLLQLLLSCFSLYKAIMQLCVCLSLDLFRCLFVQKHRTQCQNCYSKHNEKLILVTGLLMHNHNRRP
jgi:hypothetical protein